MRINRLQGTVAGRPVQVSVVDEAPSNVRLDLAPSQHGGAMPPMDMTVVRDVPLADVPTYEKG